jgi:uncharacterized protein (TIGR04255 family)
VIRRQYKNPPIEEALCELRFQGSAEWDLSAPAQFQERLRSTYGGKPRTQNVVATNVMAGSPQGPAALAVIQGQAKLQFPDADGKRLVSVAPDLLSVHVLRPYGGWEDFHQRIADALAAYEAILHPSGAVRLGVRYINRVAIRGENINLRSYFLCEPPQVEGLPASLASFVHRVEHVYEDGARIFVTYASIDGAASPEFLLDLDVILDPSAPLPLDKVMATVDELRDRERTAFEAIITSKSRELFDA